MTSVNCAGTLKYIGTTTPASERTHRTVTRDMKRAGQNHGTVHGIKGPSPVLQLTGLDLVWGFPPDYMHCVLEGVTKQLTELWLTCTGAHFYVGKFIGDLDDRLCEIRPPMTFSRSVRPLRERERFGMPSSGDAGFCSIRCPVCMAFFLAYFMPI